jgi:hypothetical protein
VCWDQKFDEPIPLPKGKKLVTLRDAALYITKLPKAEHDAGMAGGDGSADPSRGIEWPNDVRAHRYHAGIEPPRRARVRSNAQRAALGASQADRDR